MPSARIGAIMTRELDITTLIRTVADFPRPGILFRDITTLLKRADGFHAAVDALANAFRDRRIDQVAAIESRGFIIGAALAFALNTGFVPIRKQGKLPAENFGQDYALEYGTDRLEMHVDALQCGERVALVDDLVATGGTAEAALRLIGLAGASVAGCGFIVALPALGGRRRLEELGHPVFALCEFPGH